MGSIPEIRNVVLMICLVTLMTDQRHRARREMMRVCGREVILKWLVMRDVIFAHATVARRVALVAITEATFKPAPGDVFGVQQIADIFSAQTYLIGTATIVIEWVGIANQRPIDHVSRDVAQRGDHPVGLAGN